MFKKQLLIFLKKRHHARKIRVSCGMSYVLLHRSLMNICCGIPIMTITIFGQSKGAVVMNQFRMVNYACIYLYVQLHPFLDIIPLFINSRFGDTVLL